MYIEQKINENSLIKENRDEVILKLFYVWKYSINSQIRTFPDTNMAKVIGKHRADVAHYAEHIRFGYSERRFNRRH